MPGAIRLTARNGTVTGEGRIAPDAIDTASKPYTPHSAAIEATFTPTGLVVNCTTPAVAAAATNTAASARWPTSRSRSSAGWTKPIRMAMSAVKLGATNPADNSRHHSPAVVCGPMLDSA